jgi:hypothetical protein
MMRPWIAGNWKMHGTSSQLGEIEAIVTAVQAMLPPGTCPTLCGGLSAAGTAANAGASRTLQAGPASRRIDRED